MTPLDIAHAAMAAAPEDAALRLRFYDRVADAELYVLLEREATETVAPRILETDGASYVLAFDKPDRLTDFTGAISPYIGLSGRALAAMLRDQAIGIGLNLEVAPSAMLLPPEAVAWLAEALGQAPGEEEDHIAAIAPPSALPEALLDALQAKLATAGGFAREAYLATATYSAGARGTLLAFVDAGDGAERALAGAVREALVFSGIEAGALDVAFVSSRDAITAALGRHGFRLDLPKPREPKRIIPGSDPDRPPKLR